MGAGLEERFKVSGTAGGKLLRKEFSSAMVDCHCARGFWGAGAAVEVELLVGSANAGGANKGDAIVFVKATEWRSEIIIKWGGKANCAHHARGEPSSTAAGFRWRGAAARRHSGLLWSHKRRGAAAC